jgi:hypothetical protein
LKWFKHYTDALDDPFIQDLICEFGANGFLVYFGIIGLICRENRLELTGKAEFSARYLKQKLHISPAKVEEILKFSQGKGKLFFKKTLGKGEEKSSKNTENFEFNFPKILEIKDNYSKDLQAKSKKPSNQKEKEKEKEKEKDTPLDKCFQEDWKGYPRPGKKGNKKLAEANYKKTVGKDLKKNRPVFLEKLKHQIKAVSDLKFLPHAERFFRDWPDLEFNTGKSKARNKVLEFY